MDWWEGLLIVIGLSLNVFLVAEYEGTMVKKVHPRILLAVCGIFFLMQCAAITLGSALAGIPFFQKTASVDLRKMCYLLSGIIYLILAIYMIHRAWKREIILERLSEVRYKRVFLEAVVIAFFTFLAGIACGFVGIQVLWASGVTACATILAVIAGFYMGYYQGCKFRTGIYGAGGVLFLTAGVDIFLRYLA